MNNLVLHPVTRHQLELYLVAPAHAVLLVGPTGSGKLTLAATLAEKALELSAGSLADYPYKICISPEVGKSIGIEAVRQLERFLSLKVPRKTAYNRVAIIESAQELTIEAQNALLKTLEEPPQGTILIMTLSHEHSLLPTIRSRSQSILLRRPDRATLQAYFKAQAFDDRAIRQAYDISAGLPGLMQALLNHSDHPLLQATRQARQLLTESTYGRLLIVDELSKQRVLAIETMSILQQMAQMSLRTVEGPAASKWRAILTAAYKTAEDLSKSVQPKLTLTELMLSL